MSDEEFTKLSKKQKLELPYIKESELDNLTRALFIPLSIKNDGYRMCAFFVLKGDEWFRLRDYDCFRFINAEQRLKGDFENGGVQFFLEGKWKCDYGGEFIREKP